MTALVLATGLQAAVSRGYSAEEALVLAFVGLVIAGAFQLVAGLARLGHAVSYVPVPVLAGFVNASALLVLISSVPMLLGLSGMPVADILRGGFTEASLWAMAISGLTIFCNFAFDGRVRFVPAALLGLAGGSVVYHLGLSFGGQLPGPEVGHIDLLALLRMPLLLGADINMTVLAKEIDIPLLSGLSIGLLAAFDTALSSASLDMQTGSDSDVNRDLKTHGLANAAMGLLGFLPGSGTLSRSTAIINAGAQSRYANIGTAVVFILFLALLAPLVAALPLWATAGMLAATAIQAFDKPTLAKIRDILTRKVPYPRVLAGDVVVTLVVVATAVLLNLIAAVGVGIVLAVALFVLGMGRDPVRRTFHGSTIHSKVQRSMAQSQVLEREGRRIAIIEVQGALFFGACARLQSQAKALIARGAEYLVLDFRHLTSIDSTGSALLRTLAVSCAEAGGHLLISCVEPERRIQPSMRRKHGENAAKPLITSRAQLRWIWLNLEANDVIDVVGEKWIFDDTDTALAACEELLLSRLGRTGSIATRGIIASSACFTGLTRTQIMTLGRYARRHRFAAGKSVFVQGAEGSQAYFLVTGRMDVLIDIPGSVRKRRVSALTEGTLFAEMGLLDGGVRSASVKAVRTSACYSIDAENFQHLQTEMPEVALILFTNLARQFANRLRLANTMISELEQ